MIKLTPKYQIETTENLKALAKSLVEITDVMISMNQTIISLTQDIENLKDEIRSKNEQWQYNSRCNFRNSSRYMGFYCCLFNDRPSLLIW